PPSGTHHAALSGEGVDNQGSSSGGSSDD
ncbi:MAG: hypothetical protein ACI8RZ_007633, partial [Myxococcota bacterium]